MSEGAMTTTTTSCLGCAVAAGRERVACAVHHVHPPDVPSWDWRQQPDLAELARIVRERSGGQVHLTPVENTGDDQAALIVSSEALTQEQASATYWRHSENVTERAWADFGDAVDQAIREAWHG